MEFWQVLLTSSLTAAVVTIVVSRILKRFDDDELRSGIKQAIQAEIDYASEFALEYLKPGSVKSPMHRITTAFYDEGVPKLISLRAIDYECAQALLQYYGNIDQLNRSLDLAASLEGKEKLEEIIRTIYKACSLVQLRDLQTLMSTPRPNKLEHRIISKKASKYSTAPRHPTIALSACWDAFDELAPSRRTAVEHAARRFSRAPLSGDPRLSR